MSNTAGKGGLADNVAGHTNCGRVETFGQRDPAAFCLVTYRADCKVVAQYLATAFMHYARGNTDVGVLICGDVFLDEIDESRLALQQAEEL